VLDEINYARQHPREYARELQRIDADWRPDNRYATDDPRDVEEAVDFLMRQPPLPPLRLDERLSEAALDHAATQGPRGQLGHTGPRGETLGQRLQRRGMWAGLSAENISYGYDDPGGVVRQLIIDSGVPNRAHRQNIFSHSYQAAGAGCDDAAAADDWAAAVTAACKAADVEGGGAGVDGPKARVTRKIAMTAITAPPRMPHPMSFCAVLRFRCAIGDRPLRLPLRLLEEHRVFVETM